MKIRVKSFLHDESGAVTVDWVVLTAAVIGLLIGSFSLFVDTKNDINAGTAALISSVTF